MAYPIFAFFLPVFFLTVFSSQLLIAADEPSSEPVRVDPVVMEEAADGESELYPLTETAAGESETEDSELTKSPAASMIRSCFLPGWGQFYTEHPYRGSMLFSMEALLLTFAWLENREANRSWDLLVETGESRYQDEYDRHFDRAYNLMSFSIALYLFNIADAYVSAHLFDFESKVSLESERGRVEISMRFP